jgi:DNA replication protein DnaC
MVDRRVHHAEVISINGDSYRPRERDLGRVLAAKNND